MTKKKVAILGGGPGGLSAAFHLAKSQQDLDITVYTMGWRLGGKGASGRNFEMADRIEEHGIHLFGNFYPNALHMVKECYDTVEDFEHQFQPMNLQLLTEFYGGRWHRFATRLAKSGKQPWETDQIIAPLDDLVEKTIGNLHEIFHTQELSKQKAPPRDSGSHWFVHLISPLVRRALKKTMPSGDAHLTGEHENDSFEHGHTWRHQSLSSRILRGMLGLMGFFARFNARIRYIYTQLDHLVGCIHGYQVFDLKHNGLASINHWDHLRWLKYCGVSDMTLAAPIVKAIPNVCFQFPFGNTTGKPSMAASAYMTYILRQMLASGDNVFFFREGTGETAILPLYDKLKSMGVKFEFFNKVRDVIPAADAHTIERIEIDVQAQTIGDYDPIVERVINGQKKRVWPATTPYDKLVDGDALKAAEVNLESWWRQPPATRKTLMQGQDFDYAIMAVPIGAHPFTCPSLMEDADKTDYNQSNKAAWKSMHEHVYTIPTQAFQMWLKEPLDELGLPSNLLKPGERYAGPTYNNPMSGWTDFSDMIQLEGWSAIKKDEAPPQTLLYFCGALQQLQGEIPIDDPTYPDGQYERVKSTIVQELSHINGLLPTATREDNHQQMRFELLESAHVDHNNEFEGEQRAWCQHIRVNIDPNERYTVSQPGHERHLRHAWDSGYSNLALAGDWTFTGFNIGSFEGSVMSGKLASYALTGYPHQDDIYGFNFLREPPKPDNVPMIKM
ncbi:MAG: FAD-dependent oxidoreductase [Woeseiaceae bacterium]